MLVSKILNIKKTFFKSLNQNITDLIYSTFRFPNSNTNNNLVAVNEFENMRPDSVANRIYGDQTKWDALLKYNGISNPFSIKFGDILYAIPFSDIDSTYVKPRDIPERKGKNETDFNILVDGRDKNRINNLKQKASFGPSGKLPPNLNKDGDMNVKIKDGRVIFGEDVTTINKKNCPVPISRARLQTALLKDKLFL